MNDVLEKVIDFGVGIGLFAGTLFFGKKYSDMCAEAKIKEEAEKREKEKQEKEANMMNPEYDTSAYDIGSSGYGNEEYKIDYNVIKPKETKVVDEEENDDIYAEENYEDDDEDDEPSYRTSSYSDDDEDDRSDYEKFSDFVEFVDGLREAGVL